MKIRMLLVAVALASVPLSEAKSETMPKPRIVILVSFLNLHLQQFQLKANLSLA